MIDFKQIQTGEDFELLCESLLRAKQFRIVDAVARGSDGGKDLIISETVTDRTDHTEERKTLVQCKHNAHSDKAVSFGDVVNWRDACDGYRVTRYLLICSTVPTEDLRRKFQATTEKGDYVAVIWSRNDIERYLTEYPDVRDRYFPEDHPAGKLAHHVAEWLRALGYTVAAGPRAARHVDMTVEVKMTMPLIGEVTQKVLLRCLEGEIQAPHVVTLAEDLKTGGNGKGQLITDRRVTATARAQAAGMDTVEVMTFDELIDKTARFDGYFEWLEAEVKRRGVDKVYVPLACTKDELDPSTGEKAGENRYDGSNGWIDGYIDRWLDDPAKEHISILGEFGTGKTWFALHYAYNAMKKFRKAREQGVRRPRVPLVIQLRDYAKMLDSESLFSDFFFRKHEIPLPGYSAFAQLNRMGRLLLIFDGFDEMAAKVDRQQMINNFWELARVVVPGAKAILTCRTEHFPQAREGRDLLNAKLLASTAALTGEPPQFEVLNLETFDDDQIRKALSLRTNEKTVDLVLSHPQLRDLARRPVMMEFVLDALPDIEAGKQVDLARVYLYAVGAKLDRDIKSERTFTSTADKLYFMCELSWDMLTQDRMSLNYRMFPDRLKDLFGDVVAEQKDLDHWHYDMMGNTLLVRNGDGDYSPAHRSLLEFFVAYRIAAGLGVLPEDFVDLARTQAGVDSTLATGAYTWRSYFQRRLDDHGRLTAVPPLESFQAESDMHTLLDALGAMGDNVYRFLHEMTNVHEVRERFHRLLARELDLYQAGKRDARVEQRALVCLLKARRLCQVWEEEAGKGHAVRQFWRDHHKRECKAARAAISHHAPVTGVDGGDGVDICMVEVPAGQFLMGGVEEDFEQPVHLVRFDAPFLVGQTPVTNSQYMRFAKDVDGHWPEWCEPGSDWKVQTGKNGYYRELGAALTQGDCPVVGISWEDAIAFANWMSDQQGLPRCYSLAGGHARLDVSSRGYRLLTEAEWEYACRAGCSSRFSSGDGDKDLLGVAWYGVNSEDRTHAVGQKSPNAWGVLDMHGNVWEWVEDDWHSSYEGAPSDGSAWIGRERGSLRVVRGGSWYDPAEYCRSAFRNFALPDYRIGTLGFRLSRSVS